MIATDLPDDKPQPACLNLKALFGQRYKIVYEETYYAEYGPEARIEDPWLMIMPCQNGDIFPWGGSVLAASTDKAGPVAKRLKALPFTTVAQDGTDGAMVLSDIEHFETVAEIMQPRRRRRLSAQARRVAGERLRKWQFRPAVETAGAAQESKVGLRVVF